MDRWTELILSQFLTAILNRVIYFPLIILLQLTWLIFLRVDIENVLHMVFTNTKIFRSQFLCRISINWNCKILWNWNSISSKQERRFCWTNMIKWSERMIYLHIVDQIHHKVQNQYWMAIILKSVNLVWLLNSIKMQLL